jgi:hypothetical protein
MILNREILRRQKFEYYSPFHECSFCQLIDKYLDFKFIEYFVEYENITYEISVFQNKNGLYQIGAVGYGYVFPFPEEFRVFKYLLEQIRKTFGEVLKIILPPFINVNICNWPLSEMGFKINIKYTAILNLNKYKVAGDMSFKGRVRTDIRYSIKNGVYSREYETQNDLLIFYNIYLDTMKRLNASYYTPFKMIEDAITKSKIAKLYLAIYQDNIIAGSIFLQSAYQSFYWINASEYKYRNLRGNYNILQYVVNKNANHNIKTINFGYSHNQNILNTKLAWGCSLVEYYDIESVDTR